MLSQLPRQPAGTRPACLSVRALKARAGAAVVGGPARKAAVPLRWLSSSAPAPAEPLSAAVRVRREVGAPPSQLGTFLRSLVACPTRFPAGRLLSRICGRGLPSLAAAGSAGRVNPEECGGRNVHADEMDANLMLMSGGRPGLSRAPRAQTAAGLRRQP